MTNPKKITLKYKDGGENILVQIMEQTSAVLTAGELSAVIRIMADARALLLPPVEISDLIAGQKLDISVAIRWYVDSHPDGNKVLMLLHPGLGWIAMKISVSEANRLSGLLIEEYKIGSIPRAN